MDTLDLEAPVGDTDRYIDLFGRCGTDRLWPVLAPWFFPLARILPPYYGVIGEYYG
jgi:hypothetical protein